jgi:hypothetical protein
MHDVWGHKKRGQNDDNITGLTHIVLYTGGYNKNFIDISS